MNLTLIIAIMGCVTGITSLLIQLFSYLSTVARLDISIDKSSNSYFFNTKDFKISGYKTNFSAVVSLIISNKSSYPITIDGIYIKSNKIKYTIKHFNEFKFHPQEISIGDNSITYYPPSAPINLPLRIEAFDTIFASARFPFFDPLIDCNDLSKPVKFKLIIHTPRRTFHCKAKLYEYMFCHGHHQEFRNK